MSYETQDASIRIIGVTAALLTLGLAVSLGATAWWYRVRNADLVGRGEAIRQTSFANGPSAEPDIRRDSRRVDADATERLSHYGWVDREAGLARIPIERAMALAASGARPAPGPKEPGQVP